MSRPSPTAVHLSRRELALDTRVWRATGAMTLFIAFAFGLLPIIDTGEVSPFVSLVWALFTVIAIGLLLREPPTIGSQLNHAVVALPWLGASLIFLTSNIGAGIAVSAAMFIGPLASVRLQDQRQFVLHLVAATAAFALVAVLRGFDVGLTICLLITAMAMWVLGLSCWVVLAMAELQGDELDRLVRRDPLTGIGNRRLLDERLEQALERSSRTRQPFSIVLLDLNGFKAINDQLGHADGDAVLRGVALALERAIDPDELVVRQGGDEFCVLLPASNQALAVRTTNALRAALAGVGDGVTAGYGIATYPEDAVDATVLMHVADARLRADKAGGPPRGGASSTDSGDDADEPGAPLGLSA